MISGGETTNPKAVLPLTYVVCAGSPDMLGLEDEMSYLYFIQRGEDGPIKIGISQSPTKRLNALRTASPDGHLYVLRRVVTVHRSKIRVLEKNLHKHFAEHRVNGEWFEPIPELVAMATRRT